jgi:hypothetical protein
MCQIPRPENKQCDSVTHFASTSNSIQILSPQLRALTKMLTKLSTVFAPRNSLKLFVPKATGQHRLNRHHITCWLISHHCTWLQSARRGSCLAHVGKSKKSLALSEVFILFLQQQNDSLAT